MDSNAGRALGTGIERHALRHSVRHRLDVAPRCHNFKRQPIMNGSQCIATWGCNASTLLLISHLGLRLKRTLAQNQGYPASSPRRVEVSARAQQQCESRTEGHLVGICLPYHTDCLRLASVVPVLELFQHPERDDLSVAVVADPDFPSERLQIVVGMAEWNVGDLGLLISVGAKVPEGLIADKNLERALSRKGHCIERVHVCNVSSHGLLLPLDQFPQVPAQPGVDCARILGIHPACESERRVALELAFLGTRFHGSAISDSVSVEGELRDALLRIGVVPSGHEASLIKTGRGWYRLSRTDAGVHARSFALTTPPLRLLTSDLNPDACLPALANALNRELTSDLKVLNAAWIPAGADLQSASVAREYRYYLPSVLLGPEPDAEAQLFSQISMCVGLHSFTNFTNVGDVAAIKKRMLRSKTIKAWVKALYAHRRSRRDTGFPEGTNLATMHKGEIMPAAPAEVQRLTRREMLAADVITNQQDRDAGLICIRLVGRGFLYNMVRLIVGSACAVARGLLKKEVFKQALAGEHGVDLSEFLAPPHGLVLYGQHLDPGHASWLMSRGGVDADAFFQSAIATAIRSAWRANTTRDSSYYSLPPAPPAE